MNHKITGLTIVETLIVLAILSILVLSLYTVFRMGAEAWTKSETRLEVYQASRAILDQISRELPGAFVGGGATFSGIGGRGGGPDTIEFVTDFGGDIYKLMYSVQVDTTTLVRKYIENPSDFASVSYNSVNFAFNVKNIDFKYVASGGTSADDWNSALSGWTTMTVLPEAVKVTLTLVDDEDKEYTFETIVYLPNSE